MDKIITIASGFFLGLLAILGLGSLFGRSKK